MIISLLIETKWNVKLWFAVDYYYFYINSGTEIFNTFYFNACLCKMSRMLLPRLINLIAILVRRLSRKCICCKYSAGTGTHHPHVHLETNREANRNDGSAVAAVAHAPPDSGRRGMVYLPGAINVADIMDSELSYRPIFLRNYSTLLRNERDSIKRGARYIRALTSPSLLGCRATLPSFPTSEFRSYFFIIILVHDIGFFLRLAINVVDLSVSFVCLTDGRLVSYFIRYCRRRCDRNEEKWRKWIAFENSL